MSVEETSSIHNRGKDPEEFIAKLLKVASVSLILWCFPLAPCLGFPRQGKKSPHCVDVNAEGMWAGHQQHLLWHVIMPP